MTYTEKLKSPLWQKKRLEILNRDKFTCRCCRSTEKTLHVHHRYYEKGKAPWEYPDEVFLTLCEECHEIESERLEMIGKMVSMHNRESLIVTSLVEALDPKGESHSPAMVRFLGGICSAIRLIDMARIFGPCEERSSNLELAKTTLAEALPWFDALIREIEEESE